MKKFLFAAVCLFLCCVAFSQDKVSYRRAADVRYTINAELAKQSRGNHFNYAAFGPQKTREEIAQEKREFVLCCFAGVFILACFCVALFPVVKNKFNHIKNKTKLHHKQRAGKHTLDDVFAAEKKE